LLPSISADHQYGIVEVSIIELVRFNKQRQFVTTIVQCHVWRASADKRQDSPESSMGRNMDCPKLEIESIDNR